MSRAARLVVALALANVALLVVPPARAHVGDPAIVTVLDSVTPALPAGVEVDVAASVAAQLVARNTTSTPLEVLGDAGEVFLRISSRGVEANLGSASWYDSNLPSGRAAGPASGLFADRFARVQEDPAWGWFDHRLHPDARRVTAEVRAARGRSRLAEWAVPMRYGATAVTVRGHVEYRPVLGRLVTAVTEDPLPDGVELTTVDGRLPAVFLRSDGRRQVQVLDPRGDVFARFDADGVRVSRRSPVHVEDQRGKDQLPSLAPAGGGLVLVTSAPSYAWLDLRLRYSEPAVPDRVQQAAAPTVLVEWTIPVVIGDQRYDVRGTTSFVPTRRASSGGRELPAVPLAIGGLAAVAVAALGVIRRRRAAERRAA